MYDATAQKCTGNIINLVSVFALNGIELKCSGFGWHLSEPISDENIKGSEKQNYREAKTSQLQERCWMRLWAIMCKPSNHRVGESRGRQPNSLIQRTSDRPLVRVFIPFLLAMDWSPWPVFRRSSVSKNSVHRGSRFRSMRTICPNQLSLFKSYTCPINVRSLGALQNWPGIVLASSFDVILIRLISLIFVHVLNSGKPAVVVLH